MNGNTMQDFANFLTLAHMEAYHWFNFERKGFGDPAYPSITRWEVWVKLTGKTASSQTRWGWG